MWSRVFITVFLVSTAMVGSSTASMAQSVLSRPGGVTVSPPVPGQAPPQYWYYCDDAKAYYPYVRDCPTGWRAVSVQEVQARIDRAQQDWLSVDEAVRKCLLDSNQIHPEQFWQEGIGASDQQFAKPLATCRRTVESARKKEEAARAEQAAAEAARKQREQAEENARRERQQAEEQERLRIEKAAWKTCLHALAADRDGAMPDDCVRLAPKYAVSFSFDQMARDPDRYEGQFVRVIGRIVQAEQEQGVSVFRIDVGPILANHVVLVRYTRRNGESRFLDSDVVEAYGSFAGVTTYESIFHQNITVPFVTATTMRLIAKGGFN